MLTPRLASLALAVLALAPGPAAANTDPDPEPDPDPSPTGASARAEADQHARRGIALYRLGRFLEAIDEFELAYTLHASDTLLYNIGQAHRRLDHSCEASSKYRSFLDGSPDSALAADVRLLLPDLERACEMTERTPLNPSDGPSSPPRPEESPVEPLLVSAPPPSQVRVAAGLGIRALSSADATEVPLGLGISAMRPLRDGRVEVGGQLGLGWFGVERGGSATAVSVLATASVVSSRGPLVARAGAGVGGLMLEGIGESSLVVSRGRPRGTMAMPLIAAVASVDREVVPGWSVHGAATLAVGPGMSVMRGGALTEVSLLIGVGYTR